MNLIRRIFCRAYQAAFHFDLPLLPYREPRIFGGFGESGSGAYHGKSGFDVFSDRKSIVEKKMCMDLATRCQPHKSCFNKYKNTTSRFLRRILNERKSRNDII